MKRYGICTTEKDSTPGFRSADVTIKWFASEVERNEHYEKLTRQSNPDLRDMMIDDNHITYSYEKIEE